MFSCKKKIESPEGLTNKITVTTTPASSITKASATSGGNITEGGTFSYYSNYERGICWSTSQNPTTADSKTTDGSGTGTFTSSITGLSPNTTYYVKAYARYYYIEDFVYGNQINFTTLVQPCGGITSFTYGGQTYYTVEIGTQCCMAENLNIGTRIDGFNDQTNNATIEKYCLFADFPVS